MLFIYLFLIIAVICGCDDQADLKAPTAQTPESRVGLRHDLDLEELVVEQAKPISNTPIYDLKVGFIMSGKIGDYGFSYSQNQGLLALRDKFGVESQVIVDVPEDESSLAAIQQLIDNGCQVIFTPSYGYFPYTDQMAKKYPEIYFFSFAGQEIRPNLSQYFGRMYQARYLSGLVAGLRTQTGRIGFVAAKPIAQVLRGASAFALGVKRVNPHAKVYLRWSDSWNDPARERELALQLINEGCDVISHHQNSVAAVIAAEESGVWSIGYHSSMLFFAPNGYLTGVSWNWAPFMIDQVAKIHGGTWKPGNYWGGLIEGVVHLDHLTDQAAPGTAEIVAAETLAIKRGYDVFIGPIYDNEGRLRVEPGRMMTDAEMLSMDWLTDNIVGEARP